MADPLLNAAISFGDAVTDTRTSAQGALYPIWTKREQSGGTYRYVQMDAGATAAVDGNLAFHVGGATNGPGVVTATAANTAPNLSCGVFQSVIPASGYGWILTKGADTLNTSGVDDIVKGTVVIETLASAGTIRMQIVATADTAAAVLVQTKLIIHPIGIALADDDDGTNTCRVMVNLE